MMNLDEIKRILEMAREHSLSEFEIEQQGIRLRIKRDGARGPASVIAAAEVAAPRAPAEPTEVPSDTDAEDSIELAVVKSPIVGTFYRSPDPNARPFVESGDTVRRGQVLCIIEAMKLMNEIDSEVDGEVVEVFVENGQPVQYGDQLFAIRPRQAG
jgi:acetyl-CoA carboxylase biotin carboxyl carrier protein